MARSSDLLNSLVSGKNGVNFWQRRKETPEAFYLIPEGQIPEIEGHMDYLALGDEIQDGEDIPDLPVSLTETRLTQDQLDFLIYRVWHFCTWAPGKNAEDFEGPTARALLTELDFLRRLRGEWT